MPDAPLKHRRMTAQEFYTALVTHQLTQGQFVRLTGTSRKKVMEWAEGTEDIPAWVPMFFAACSVPGGLEAARRESEGRLL